MSASVQQDVFKLNVPVYDLELEQKVNLLQLPQMIKSVELTYFMKLFKSDNDFSDVKAHLRLTEVL